MRKMTLKYLLLSVYISVTLSIIIWLIGGLLFDPHTTYGPALLGVVIVGAAIGVGSVLYSVMNNTFVAALLHVLISAIVFSIVAYVLNWFPQNIVSILVNLVIFVAIFFAIWTGFYVVNRRKVENVNRELAHAEGSK